MDPVLCQNKKSDLVLRYHGSVYVIMLARKVSNLSGHNQSWDMDVKVCSGSASKWSAFAKGGGERFQSRDVTPDVVQYFEVPPRPTILHLFPGWERGNVGQSHWQIKGKKDDGERISGSEY